MSKRAAKIAIEKGFYIDDAGEVWINGRPKVTSLRKGYKRFTIRDAESRMIPVLVHQLQALQTYGDEYLKLGVVARHLDNNPLNNFKANIAIGTAHDNAMDNPKEDRIARATHAASFNRAFTDSIVADIKRDRIDGMTYRQLILKYNTSKGTLSFLFNFSSYYKRIEV
jgi:hypothetical protein